ncbi:MAG: DUF72 domain-containing protein [Melioribacteraceae bacterium]|nr:DUF72 domain-containing protein [Melioribacteraceae bacterium]
MAELRIGTCSWKYESWKGIVYSGSAGKNYLAEYSERYNTVEIDQWFWSLFGEKKVSLPDSKVIGEYVESVPDDFKFTIKLPNSLSLTHFYKNNKNEMIKINPYFLKKELYIQLLDIFRTFGAKLGPLMLQFEYMNKQKMSSQKDFQMRLKNFFEEIGNTKNLALEIRNPNYLNDSLFRFIENEKIITVLLHGYYMPPVFEVYEKYKDYILGTVVIRLHGPDRRGIEKTTGGDWSRIVAPKDNELQKIVNMITDLLNREVDVYLNVNNHYEGSAPLTINKIKKLMK